MTSRSLWTSRPGRCGTTTATSRPALKAGESAEESGLSCFLRDAGEIFHTYSVYARGTEYLASAYGLLDLTAFGRSEDWEEPKGRARVLHGADPTFTD